MKDTVDYGFIYAGGCGAMYEIFVESEDFRGKRQVQQHRLVNKVSLDLLFTLLRVLSF